MGNKCVPLAINDVVKNFNVNNRANSFSQSAANVRALTYSDLHVIKRENLMG